LIAEDGANLVSRNLPLAVRANGRYWVNNHAHILRPRRGDIEFLSAYLEMIDFRPWITGAAQPKLTQDRLKSIAIAIPGAEEQQATIAAIADRVSRGSRTVASATGEIGLLREFRIRLTSDVVSGQLDVRERASALPNFVERGRVDADSDADETFDDLDEVLEEVDA
jgi:type I restriction enzyme S subunit